MLTLTLKPNPTRLHVSPFRSTNAPVAPADVGSAARLSWLMSASPASKVASGPHPWVSFQVVERPGVNMRKWMPLVSAEPFPFETLIRPAVSDPCPPAELSHGFPGEGMSSRVPY